MAVTVTTRLQSPELVLPSLDFPTVVNKVHGELTELLRLEPRPFAVQLIFGIGDGYVEPNGIHLPVEFPADATYTEQDHFECYLKHEMIHYLLQIEYRVNPAPTSFLNEGVAQSQAEGRLIERFRDTSYHGLARKQLIADGPVALREFVDSVVFLRRRRERSVLESHASFCGWLIERFGIERYLRSFAMSRGNPRDGADGSSTIAALEAGIGERFADLEAGWVTFLSEHVHRGPSAV